MKKIFLAAVCGFALSQYSFAGTSFADLIELEKASFMPQIEIEVVESETETGHTKTKEFVSENITTTDTFISKTDVSYDWTFVSSEVVDNDESYEEKLTKEDIIPNTDLAKDRWDWPWHNCKTLSRKFYDTRRTLVEKSRDKYIKIVCSDVVINGEALQECESKAKEGLWNTIEEFVGVKVELECHEYYGTAKFVKAD